MWGLILIFSSMCHLCILSIPSTVLKLYSLLYFTFSYNKILKCWDYPWLCRSFLLHSCCSLRRNHLASASSTFFLFLKMCWINFPAVVFLLVWELIILFYNFSNVLGKKGSKPMFSIFQIANAYTYALNGKVLWFR